MGKAKLSLAWQIVIGLALGIAVGAVLNHFSAEKAWWIANVLQPAGDIFIRLIKMIVISSLVVGIAGVGDAKKLGRIGLKTIIYFEIVTTVAIVVGLPLANLFQPGTGITGIHLTVTGEVPGLDEAGFVKAAEDAKANCPVSQALKGTEITLEAELAG